MKVVQYEEYGVAADVVKIIDIDTGAAEDGEIIIDIEAAPVHIADLKNLTGHRSFQFPLPATPGYEGIGRVSSVGSGVTDFEVGSRVFLPLGCGAWRQQIRVKADGCFPAPEGDAAQLSLLPINAPTAEMLLRDYGNFKEGDWIIQNAASSNCGVYLIKLAAMRGVRTVNVVRREELIPRLKEIGGDVVLLDGPDLAERVADATDGAEIRVGLDAVNGDATMRIGECLVDGGTILAYGMLSGEPCHIPSDMLFLRNIRLEGYMMSRCLMTRPRAEQLEIYSYLANLVADGTLTARIAGTYTLDQVGDAVTHAAKTGEERDGKIILLPNG